MKDYRDKSNMSQQMRIRYFIMNLIYRSGEKSVKIPSSRKLAKQFGIAHSTVQLALEKLNRENCIITRQGAPTMTNPVKQFDLYPAPTPLIGVKIYEGDAFYYGKTLWNILSSIAGELVERKFNIRLMMEVAATPESIQREVNESYLDGLILFNTSLDYFKAAREKIPSVLIRDIPSPGLPSSIILNMEPAIIQLAVLLKKEKRTRIAEVVSQHKFDEQFYLIKTLKKSNPDIKTQEILFDEVSDLIHTNPPDVLIFYEQYAETIQSLAEKSGHDILLLSLKKPPRDMNYTGYYFTYPFEKIIHEAADMLEALLAGQKDATQITIEAELCRDPKNETNIKTEKEKF